MEDAQKGNHAGPIVRRTTTALDWPRSGRNPEIEGLWFRLAHLQWRTLVFVPADEGTSAVEVTTALADVGRRLRAGPVTFLLLSGPMDYAAAGKIVRAVGGGRDAAGSSEEHQEGRLLIAIPPVVTEPLGLAVTEVADAIVLCVERGESRMQSAERTVELIGKDRIIGALML